MRESPTRGRLSAALLSAASGLLLAGSAAPLQAQPVQGKITGVGFEAAVPARHVVRLGQWVPIVVELTAAGSERREVELRCQRSDLDGDHVVYLEPYVLVNPNAVRRVWCYATTLKEEAGRPLRIEVVDKQDGTPLTTLTAPPFEPISNDTMLILDISTPRVTGLQTINDSATHYWGPDWGGRRYYRPVCVATLAARDLPDRWYGLEAVDVLVWDQPDPDALPSPAQLTALIEWVRNGGQLVVGIGPAWARIERSALAEIMPLRCTRPAVAAAKLPVFLRRYGRTGADNFPRPITVAVGEPTRDALVSLRDELPDHRPFALIALRTVGSGRVIATAARLSDLIGAPVREEFYRELFDLNRNEPEFNDNEGKRVFLMPTALHEPLTAGIQFQRLAGVRVLVAFAFVAGYILVATLGAWTWLRRRQLTHLSWTVFAGLAVVASLLSLGAVGLSRGVTGSVHSISLIDLEAGSADARARVYFGYRSSRRQRAELALPGSGNYLRPLASGLEPSPTYATPQRYLADVQRAALHQTPLRATVKQFEGFWSGALTDPLGVARTIRGELVADRASGKLLPQSWLRNELGVPILGGYVLYIDPRLVERPGVDEGVPLRVAGRNQRSDRAAWEGKYYGSVRVPPAVNVLAVELPALEPDQRLGDLGAREYATYDNQRARWAAQFKPNPKLEPMLPSLWHRQVGQWAGAFGPWGARIRRDHAAALLASTRNLYLHNAYDVRAPDFFSVGRAVTTTGLTSLDVTGWLTRGQAVLLLLVDAPSEVSLEVNGRPRATARGWCLYRVRMPISYRGRPPTGVTP